MPLIPLQTCHKALCWGVKGYEWISAFEKCLRGMSTHDLSGDLAANDGSLCVLALMFTSFTANSPRRPFGRIKLWLNSDGKTNRFRF